MCIHALNNQSCGYDCSLYGMWPTLYLFGNTKVFWDYLPTCFTDFFDKWANFTTNHNSISVGLWMALNKDLPKMLLLDNWLQSLCRQSELGTVYNGFYFRLWGPKDKILSLDREWDKGAIWILLDLNPIRTCSFLLPQFLFNFICQAPGTVV